MTDAQCRVRTHGELVSNQANEERTRVLYAVEELQPATLASSCASLHFDYMLILFWARRQIEAE
jgi:hypothetical protein